MVENAEKAINKSCKINLCSIRNYTASPEFINTHSGRHQWLIEFDVPPNDLQKFQMDLDNEIRNLNSDYDAKRTNNFTFLLVHLTVE